MESESITHYLFARETCQYSPFIERYRCRQLYRHITPNRSIFDVECPAISIKKFTMDGKYLISFSRNQHAVQVYYYNKEHSIDNIDSQASFNNFFTLKYEIILTYGVELLCKDFCLFTHDHKYMILASALPSPSLSIESISRMPSSLASIPSLDNVTFHVIHIETGKIVFTKTFEADYIYLSHHSGVNLYGPYLAITSIQHQCIQLFFIKDSGEWISIGSIGSYLHADDEYLIGIERNELVQTSQDASIDTRVNMVHGIKQRILSYLYRVAANSPTSKNDLRQYYASYSRLNSLIMWKSQFLDIEHMLIKFGSPDYIIGRNSDQASQVAFFVVYHIPSTKVIFMLNNASEELLNLYENYCDFFRPNYTQNTISLISSPSNNAYEKDNLRKLYNNMKTAKNGGIGPAVRRILSYIPLPPQCFSESPYFDPNLFSYDEKVIASMERPKSYNDSPIKFYSRYDCSLRFKIPNPPRSRANHHDTHRSKRYATFIFHPYDPFIISIQHSYMQASSVHIYYRK